MTREETIELIKVYRDKLIDSASNQLDGDIEAFEMAVKALEQEPKILDALDFAIDASNSNGETNYFVGFRNGLRYAKSLIDGEEPQFESCTEQEPKYCDRNIFYHAPLNEFADNLEQIEKKYAEPQESEEYE